MRRDPGKPASRPASIPSTSKATAATASSLPAASAPSSAPAGEGSVQGNRSPLTPKLEALVRALRAHKKSAFDVSAEVARHIRGFEKGDGQLVLTGEASVELIEVRKDWLLMAFVRLTPKGHKACDERTPARASYALFIGKDDDGSERLRLTQDFSADETMMFDARKAVVVFPPIWPAFPVFEVHYDDHDSPCLDEGEPRRGKMVELFHLTSGSRVADAVPIAADREVPGHETFAVSKVQWVRGRSADTALLVVTTIKTDVTHPCTGEGADDGSAACRDQYECERKTTVTAVTVEGDQTEVDPKTLRGHPALARVPADRTGETERACRRLRL